MLMSRKTVLTTAAALLLITIAAMNLQSGPARAQGSGVISVATSATDPDDIDVRVEIKGVIESITPQSNSVSIILLTDGTSLLVNPATQGASDLEPGQMITVIASLDGDQLVAKIITVAAATAVPTDSATPPETPPTAAPSTPSATPAATAAATCGGNNAHPVATRLADAFGVSYDEIMGWHCKGFGFGEIAKAYLLKKQTGKEAAEYLGMRTAGKGWGQIIKEAGVKPKDLAPGSAIRGTKDKPDKPDKPTKAPKDPNPGGKGGKGK
jgi:hypothetical protein